LWEIFARDAVYDTECFCQLTRANNAIIKENMSRVMRQSITSQNQSAKSANIDVGASIRQQKSIAAQEALYEGALPLQVAVMMLLHRQTLNDLDGVCVNSNLKCNA
jgi:hypothetical protein